MWPQKSLLPPTSLLPGLTSWKLATSSLGPGSGLPQPVPLLPIFCLQGELGYKCQSGSGCSDEGSIITECSENCIIKMFSCSVVSDSLQSHALQHTGPPRPSVSPGACSHSSIDSVMPSNHLILCRPLLFLPSIFPSIRVFSVESALLIRWPKFWSFSCSISPSSEYSGLIFFRIDWFDYYQNEPVFVLNQRASGKVEKVAPVGTLIWFPEVRLTSGGLFRHHV